MNVKVTLTVTLPPPSLGVFEHTVEVASHRLVSEDFYRVFQEKYAEYLAERGSLGKECAG